MILNIPLGMFDRMDKLIWHYDKDGEYFSQEWLQSCNEEKK